MVQTVVCGVCGAPGASPCPRCIAGLEPAGQVPCPAGLASCASAVLLRGVGRELVVSVKYHNERQSLGWLAAAAASVVEPGLGVQVVTWVPTSASRRRERGFDQSERLARRVGRRLGLPVRRLLRSTEAGRLVNAGGGGRHLGQTGRSAADRFGRDGFAVGRPVKVPVLLVDDVLTTGATLSAAATALLKAGAPEVHGLTIAFTPPPGGYEAVHRSRGL